MAYAKLNNQNRIIEWSYEPMFDVEFSGEEIIDEMFINTLEDFIIENGVVRFEPCAETIERMERERVEAEKQERINELPYDVSDIQDALVELADMISELIGGQNG